MLSHLDGDRAPALELFGRAKELATLFQALSGGPSAAVPKEAS
jgi:hypothetical protein